MLYIIVSFTCRYSLVSLSILRRVRRHSSDSSYEHWVQLASHFAQINSRIDDSIEAYVSIVHLLPAVVSTILGLL